MTRPKQSEHYERRWHDLAQRFDNGDTVLTSPPFESESAALAFRFRFYGFRAMLRREATPNMYRTLERIVARVVPNGGGGYCVIFAHRDATRTAAALDSMLKPVESAEAALAAMSATP